jgi:hypothetical protein
MWERFNPVNTQPEAEFLASKLVTSVPFVIKNKLASWGFTPSEVNVIVFTTVGRSSSRYSKSPYFQ